MLVLDSCIPDKVKIGSRCYSVEIDEDLIRTHNAIGYVRTDDDIIKISPSQSPASQKNTLWHETLHVINDNLMLGLEEEGIRRLDYAITQVIVDNPMLVSLVEDSAVD
jgi:hypothetical protein